MTEKLDRQFDATLQKSPARGGWTVKADVREAIAKREGDRVTVRLEERLPR